MSPFTINNNALVIGDKFIVGLNAVCGVAINRMLEEGKFLVAHTWWCGECYIYYGTSFRK